MNKLKNEIKNLSVEELAVKSSELRRELFSLRLHAVSNPLKDTTQMKKLRKNIARTLTYLNQKIYGM